MVSDREVLVKNKFSLHTQAIFINSMKRKYHAVNNSYEILSNSCQMSSELSQNNNKAMRLVINATDQPRAYVNQIKGMGYKYRIINCFKINHISLQCW